MRLGIRGILTLIVFRGGGEVARQVGAVPKARLPPPRLDTVITAQLEERVTEVEPIITTATRAEHRLEDEPQRIEVLAGENIADKTEMRPSDITMLLSEMSSVRVRGHPGLHARRDPPAPVLERRQRQLVWTSTCSTRRTISRRARGPRRPAARSAIA